VICPLLSKNLVFGSKLTKKVAENREKLLKIGKKAQNGPKKLVWAILSISAPSESKSTQKGIKHSTLFSGLCTATVLYKKQYKISQLTPKSAMNAAVYEL
jgi:hypothetical protein